MYSYPGLAKNASVAFDDVRATVCFSGLLNPKIFVGLLICISSSLGP